MTRRIDRIRKVKHLPRGAYTSCDGRVGLMTQFPDIGATLINVQHGYALRPHLTGKLSIRHGHPSTPSYTAFSVHVGPERASSGTRF